MNEIAKSNITQLLNSFDTFVRIMEDPVWVKSTQVEDIKIAFKLGNFIEKTVVNFQSKKSLDEFLAVLSEWWKTNNRTKVYSADFYLYACDQLLMKFFKFQNVPENSLEIAVRVYTSLYPKERMHNIISDLITSSSSLETVYQFINTCVPETESRILEYRFKLKCWSDLIETGKENCVTCEIKNMLSPYKIETSLYMLIGLLAVQDTSESEKQAQNVVFKHISEKMLDRNLLSKQFWFTLFKEIDLDIICGACKNYREFMLSLFNFIVYIGSMMIKENDIWISDPNISLCPEISYHDILKFIKSVSKINVETSNFVTKKLLEAKEYTDNDLWDHINSQLGNK